MGNVDLWLPRARPQDGPAASRTTPMSPMPPLRPRSGKVNSLYPLLALSLGVLLALGAVLYRMNDSARGGSAKRLLVHCAAGVQPPVEKIAKRYEKEYGVKIELNYGGSATLLSQIEIAATGDLYLAADDSYIELAREKGLVDEEFPVAIMTPVVAVAAGNPKNIRTIDDLLRDDVRVALGNPEQAAIGRKTRALLRASGHWEELQRRVTENGTFQPTVPDAANAVKLGSADAAVIWDATVAQYSELEAVRTPQLDQGAGQITLGVMTASKNPTAALRFARYMAARDRGLEEFKKLNYETIADGDVWKENPEITFFIGSVNRRALEPVIKAFERREGVRVNTNYNGCGVLTANMKVIKDQDQAGGFPDIYMACDVYYLNNVSDWFQEAVNVSNTNIVIVVQKGNPKGIQSLRDLTRPGVRVVVGQPEQCTIGALTRIMLQNQGLYEEVMENVVSQTMTSGMLVGNITTGSADAVLAYATDTLAEPDKLDVVAIDSSDALAIQPFAIARSSEQKYLGRRLYRAIANSRESFESAGFNWQLDDPGAWDAPDGNDSPLSLEPAGTEADHADDGSSQPESS